MKTLTKESLEEWTSKIGIRISIIKMFRKRYDEFVEKYNKGDIKGFDPGLLWLFNNSYEYAIILLLAGLLEGSDKKDDLNFQKFLRHVKKYGMDKLKQDLLANKPKYFTDFDNPVFEELDDNDYLEIARKKDIEEKFSKNVDIEQDIKTINNNFKLLETLRNKHYAHFTDYKDIKFISNEELDKIINETIEIFDKYSLIVKNTKYLFD